MKGLAHIYSNPKYQVDWFLYNDILYIPLGLWLI
jgi:hypothetical protein